MGNEAQNINKPQNVDQLVEIAKKVYSILQITEDIEKDHAGEYIAIDAESGKHFFGATRDEAVLKGKAELPAAIFYIRRIGGIDTVSRNYPYRTSARSVHARLL
jgi:hypothetical protein